MSHDLNDTLIFVKVVEQGSFTAAAERLGVPIERCAILEDSPVGATGAVASGGYVIGLVAGTHCAPDHAGRLRAIGVDVIARDYDEVSALLA